MVALQALLGQPTTRLGGGLPMDFAALRATGCRTVKLAGRDVLEVCFKRDGAVYHLYAVWKADFPAVVKNADAGAGATFASAGGVCCGAWSDATHRYVLATEAGMEAVKRVI